MSEIKFSELLARLAGRKSMPKSASRKTDGLWLYAQPHYAPDDDRLERVLYFLVTAQVEAECPIYLTTLKGRLEAVPFVPDLDAMPSGGPVPLDAPLWLVNLCRLCEEAVLPHIEDLRRIPFLSDDDDKPNFARVRCEQIIHDQIECFRYRRRAFFPSYEAWLQWECWSRAESWLTRQIEPEEACKMVGVDPQVQQSLMGKTLRACRSELAKRRVQTEECVDAASSVGPTVTQGNAVVASVMQRYVDPSVMIGDADLSLPKDTECVWRPTFPDFDNRRKTPISPLWWWRKLNSREECSDDLHELFFQNWARSAFLYEYRCRRNRATEQPWCGVPWAALDPIQRAILRELWPPETAGPRTFVRPITPDISEFGKLSRVTLQIPVDLATMSDKAILGQVQAELTKLRKIRRFPTAAQGEGAVQTAYRWRVLEAMDEAFYGNSTLLAKDRSAKSTVEKEYKKACEKSGIEP